MLLLLFCVARAGLLGFEEENRTFVVSRGCPQRLAPQATVRLFVAVPSAAGNLRRRQWVRATWCRAAEEVGGLASVAVAFFVGRGEPTVEVEASIYGDIIVVPSSDGADNVTAKQVHSMRYFALLHGDAVSKDDFPTPVVSRPTHYARMEDDVYVNLGLIVDDLIAGVIRSVPGPRARLSDRRQFAWAFFITEGAAHAYPSGFAFVLTAGLVRAVAAAHALAPLDVGAPPLRGATKPPRGKGGYHAFGWSTDDAFVGLLLRPFNHDAINDRRFHDPVGRGLNAFPASASSLAVHGLRAWHEFSLLHARNFTAFNQIVTSPDLPRLPSGESVVWMEVDGRPRAVPIRGCEGIDAVAANVCRTFVLDARMCAALTEHFFAVCPLADAAARDTAATTV